MGLQQQPGALPLGAGERAARVAEQFALGQRGAERRQVHGHERTVGAAAVAVDRAGRQFLAGAAFSAQQDAGLRGGRQRDAFEHLLHHGRSSHQPGGVFRAGRRRELRPAGHCPPDRPLGRLQVERLNQVLERALADGLDGRVQIAVGGDDDDRRIAATLAQLLHRRQAVQAGQADVEHHGIGRLLGGQFQRLLGGRGRDHFVAQAFPQAAQGPADARFVIHDQQSRHGHPPRSISAARR